MQTIKELDDLKLPNDTELKQKLQQCLDDDLSALTQLVTSRNERKERNVPSLAVGFVFGAGLTIPLWFMWEPQKWWTWLIFGTVAFLATIMFLGALLAWRKPPNPPREKKPKSGAVQGPLRASSPGIEEVSVPGRRSPAERRSESTARR